MTIIGQDTADGPGSAFSPVSPPGPIERLRSSVIARFASVGVINTAVDFGVYVVLYSLGMSPVPANFISTSAGLVVSFVGNSRFVFRSGRSRVREVVLFVLAAGIGIWVIQPLVILGTTRVLEHLGMTASALVGAVAKLVAIAVAAVWNYLTYSRIVFRRAHEPREDGPAA